MRFAFCAVVILLLVGAATTANASSRTKPSRPFQLAAARASHKADPEHMAALAAYHQTHGLPSSINWVAMGGVTPVSDQGSCGGGCVAYAVTANVEGVNFATNHKLVPLSAEEVVACAMTDGCCGGFPSDAIQWFLTHTNGKICTAASMPYNSSDGIPGPCSTNCTTGAQVTKSINLPKSELAIATSLVMNGPVAVAVDATTWQLYTGGVFANCTYSQLDHTAVAVGYDDTHNPPYWLIKNSWGTSWGENGYIRIAKGSNQCGVKELATTVQVKRR